MGKESRILITGGGGYVGSVLVNYLADMGYAIRAFHKHDLSWDYFSIVRETAKLVFVDDGENSQSYKQQEIIVISEKCPKTIIVPPGVYHGWMSLEDNTLMISTASEFYDREKPDEIRIPPDSFGDAWTVKGK